VLGRGIPKKFKIYGGDIACMKYALESGFTEWYEEASQVAASRGIDTLKYISLHIPLLSSLPPFSIFTL
jgi:hypothetical protein